MPELVLELYVIAHSRNSEMAVANLRRLCEGELRGRCHLQIVDILEHPVAAETANIVATPTLIRRAPLPVRRIVGDLSLSEVVLDALGSDLSDDEQDSDKGHLADGR